MKHAKSGSTYGLTLAASLLSCSMAWGQTASSDQEQPTQVEVHARAIPPGPHCTYTVVDKLPVAMKDGLATVKGEVNGKKAAMLVDTGSIYSALGMQEAQQMGLRMLHTQLSETEPDGKETMIYAAKVNRLDVGKHGWRSLQMEVSQEPERAGVAVGADVMLNAYERDVEFSLANKEIKVFVPKGCSDAFLAYWDENANEIPLADLSPGDPRQIVTVQIDGHPMTALIDSGSPHSIIDLEAAKRIGLDPHAEHVVQTRSDGSVHRRAREWQVSVQSFAIGEETINRPRIAVADLWGYAKDPMNSDVQTSMRMAGMSPNLADHFAVSSTYKPTHGNASTFNAPDMVLGADFLQSHRVLLAMSQGRMYFTYVGGRVFGGTSTTPGPQS